MLAFSIYSKCQVSNGIYKVTFEENRIINYIILYTGLKETKAKSILFYKIKKNNLK
jgi:hypothetical protein